MAVFVALGAFLMTLAGGGDRGTRRPREPCP
jgi:hypothetical protein